MKKTISFILAILLALSIATIGVFADDADYVPSPELSETETGDEPPASSGCFSVVGAGTAAIVISTVAAAAVSLKKKED